jgi:7,8-dihydropterin-6-yl-methyl-4-(beta-D-ribofuranosyl)aminobenzene 5'-phosphate synthase
VLATGPVQIAPGVTLLPDISSAYPLPAGNERLLLASSNGTRPDPFDHELAIVVEEACEIVVITGCAHRGILNIVATCADAFPRHPIRAVVGGFHLNSEADAAVVAVANGLRERAVRQVVTGHCTGRNALAILTAELGDERVTPLATGCRFAFPV